MATSTYTLMAIQICVFTAFSLRAEKRLDAQMLLDPFEEQLHLPTAFVELGDGQSRKLEIVGEEPEAFVVLFVIKNDVAQILRMVVG